MFYFRRATVATKRVPRYHTVYRLRPTRNSRARVRADSAAELRDAATKSRNKAAARVPITSTPPPRRRGVPFTTTTHNNMCLQRFPTLRKKENITRTKYNNYCASARESRRIFTSYIYAHTL